VDLIIDASSVINLDNVQALNLVTGLKGRTFWISPLVLGECNPACAAEILRLEQSRRIRFVDPNNISAEVFLGYLENYNLGEGETECLVLCLGHPYVLCCDDHKARYIASHLLAPERIIGSLRLLKWCVFEGLMSPEEAFSLYDAMKASGGFLPEMPLAWFSDSN
jgi:predicted nucleic acid-binding protein